MARKRATLSDLLNELTFRTVYDKFKMIAINIFEWDGLPDGIEEKHLETFLFEHGKAIFFRDPMMSFMCLKADEGGELNVYGEPLKWWATGFGYHREYRADECVIIDNNKLRIATEAFVMFYANKIAEAERTMDVNVKTCKTPFIFACDDKDLLSFKQIFKKIDGNEPVIFSDKGLDLDSLTVLQTGVRFMGNELQDYKNSVENELLTFLGKNNVSVDKKERLITDEAEANDELIESFVLLQLEARQRACKAIKELYGLDVRVRIRCSHDQSADPEKEENADAVQ